TTLFVLINAVINSFRLVDHIVVMTKGGPDNTTALLLYYIYDVGFKFWDGTYAAALTLVLLVILAAPAMGQFLFLDRRTTYQWAARPRLAVSAMHWRRSAPGSSASCGCCRSRTRCGPRSILPSSPRASSRLRRSHSRTSRTRGSPLPSRAISSTPFSSSR